MNFRRFNFNRFVAIVLFISFVVGPVFLGNPQKATALLQPVPTVSSIDLKETGVTIFGIPTGLSLDAIAFMAANVVIAEITDSIVSWIDSGFQGSPVFIQDPAGWFLETADIVSGAFIDQLGVADFLCGPFVSPIRISLSYQYNRTFAKQYKCKLSDVVKNVEDFAEFTSGNFTGKGGWDTWFNVTQNSSNNPYGVYFGAQVELDRRIAKAVGLEQNKLNWGSGFLSTQECEVWDTPTGREPPEGGPVSGTVPHDCKKYGDIKTPGSVIEKQLNNALDSELSRIEVADEINEILGALINQLVTQVFTNGLASSGGGALVNEDFSVTCSHTPDSVFLDPPTNPTSQPVVWKLSVSGGKPGSVTTYEWIPTGNPSPTTPPLVLTNETLVPVTYSTAGLKEMTVHVSKEVEGEDVIRKTAYCSLDVLPNPPIEITDCSVDRLQIHRTRPQEVATWTVTTTGGVPNPSNPGDMGTCYFSGGGIRPIEGNLIRTPSGAKCSVETNKDDFRSPAYGEFYLNVYVSSGSQTASESGCGPLFIVD